MMVMMMMMMMMIALWRFICSLVIKHHNVTTRVIFLLNF